jgi:hypothetical protein
VVSIIVWHHTFSDMGVHTIEYDVVSSYWKRMYFIVLEWGMPTITSFDRYIVSRNKYEGRCLYLDCLVPCIADLVKEHYRNRWLCRVRQSLCRERNFAECGSRQSSLCRVLDKKHSVKSPALSKDPDSGSGHTLCWDRAICSHPTDILGNVYVWGFNLNSTTHRALNFG